jgi:Flp pilus assembly protein TadG
MIRAGFRKLLRLAAATGGAAAVEMAIATPFLTAALLGIVQYGGMIMANQQMHDGVSSAAVYVMRGGADATTIKSIATSAWPNKPADAAVSVTQICSCAGVGQSCTLLCADGSYPQAFTTITATGTYNGVWTSQSMTTSQVVRTQ